MSIVILLLSGWASSGKDEVAKRLSQHHQFIRLGFADPVKYEYAEQARIPWTDLFDRTKKEGHRMSLIRYAEAKRAEDPGYWAKRIAAEIQEHVQKGSRKFVISDWRNLPELLTIQSYFSQATLLPVQIRRAGQILSPIPNQQTEYGLLGFPFWHEVKNDGLLEELDNEVETLVVCVRSITEKVSGIQGRNRKMPRCTDCRWGTGTTREKPTVGSKEMEAKLAAIQAERAKQDQLFSASSSQTLSTSASVKK